MCDKHQVIEEPCKGKLLRTVLKTSETGDSLAEFNGPISLDEHEDIEKVSQWANLISEHSAESGAIAAYISWAEDAGLEVSSEEFESRYCGHWESGEDFALKSGEIEELYQWNQFEKEHHFWSMMIDWERVGRELELSDAYYYADASQSGNYGIYVFRYC